MKKLLVGFAFAGLLMANTKGGSKSYTVNITEKYIIGDAQVKPGEYRMKIEGAIAVFSDDQSRQIAKASVTLSTVARKFEYTEVISSKAPDDSARIDGIELQGTKLKVQFHQ